MLSREVDWTGERLWLLLDLQFWHVVTYEVVPGELTDRIEADISGGTDWNMGGRYVNGPNPCQGHKAGCDIREASGDAPQTSAGMRRLTL